MINMPKSLGNHSQRMDRLSQLHEPHVEALTAFVEHIREERQCGDAVPYFDPADGGVEAEILYILEAPGANAVKSGFISRNNPDESAKNWLRMNAQAGVPRKLTVIFNIVPWYIGAGGKIRAAKSADIEQGWPYLLELLGMLQTVENRGARWQEGPTCSDADQRRSTGFENHGVSPPKPHVCESEAWERRGSFECAPQGQCLFVDLSDMRKGPFSTVG